MRTWDYKRRVIVLVALAVAACTKTDAAIQKKAPPTFNKDIGTVRRQDLVQQVTIAGTIVSNRETTITAPYPGYVRKLYVKIGDPVKSGDPIVSIAQTLNEQGSIFPLRAPFPGTVVQVQKKEGEYVKQNEQEGMIVRIDDLTKLFVNTNVPELDMVKIKTGQETLIKATALPGKTFQGVIRDISLAAKTEQFKRSSEDSGVFPAKIEILGSTESLKPGMSAVVDVITSKRENALALGHEFVKRKNQKYFVKLADGTEKEIQVGIQTDIHFEVLSGLSEGDQVRTLDFLEMMDLN